MKTAIKTGIFFFLISLLFLPSLFAGGNGYKVKIHIQGAADTWLRVGYQYGDTRYQLDSLLTDKKGWATWEGDTLIAQGVYQIFLPDTTFFEFLMGEDQDFTLKTEKGNLTPGLEAIGSVDNEISVNYAKFLKQVTNDAKPWQAILARVEKGSDSAKLATDSLVAIDNSVADYQENLLKEHKGTFAADLIAAMQQAKIPPAPAEMSDSLKPYYRFNYVRDHYFDHMDLSDPRFLRAGIYHTKIMYYMEKLTYQNPDSLWKSANWLVEQSKHNRQTFQYTLATLTNHYATINIMGFDYVFARLAETYYLTGLADWASEKMLEDMEKHARTILITMPGDPAAEIRMKNLYGDLTSLYGVKSPWTIVVFWSYSCGHCRKEIPKVHRLYEAYKSYGVECFAVSTDQDREGWQEYIEENNIVDWINCIDIEHYSNFRKDYGVYSTPIIYLLDKDKKIKAKKVSVETLDDILSNELDTEKLYQEIVEDEKKKKEEEDDGEG